MDTGRYRKRLRHLTRLLSKLPAGSEAEVLLRGRPCGYGIQRQLTAAGHDCVVVAPLLILRKPGDRIKTDRRNAINLAKPQRPGKSRPYGVPTFP